MGSGIALRFSVDTGVIDLSCGLDPRIHPVFV